MKRKIAAVAILALAVSAVLVYLVATGRLGSTTAADTSTGTAGTAVAAAVPGAAPGLLRPSAREPVPVPTTPPALVGLVRDAASGDPLPRADVLALPEAEGGMPEIGAVAPGPGGVSATTDANGRFVFARLAPGWYRLRASADGYHLPPGREPAVFVRPPGAGAPAEAELAMVPLAQLSGQVIDRAGAPVGGVEVRCAASDDAPEDAPLGLGREATAADGLFDLLCFPGEVVLHARKDGFENGKSEPVRVAPAGHLGGIVIVLHAGTADGWPAPALEEDPPSPARLAGRVLDAGGVPITAFRIHVSRITGTVPRGRARAPVARTVVASDGRFEIAGLWPGRYNVLASGAGALAPARVPGVELHPAGLTDVGDLTLAVAGSVSGRVTEAGTGRPIAGVSVSISGSLGDVAPYLGDDVFTREDGTYLLEGVLPGKRSVEFSHPMYNLVLRTGSLFGARETVRLDVELSPRVKKGSGTIEYAGIGAVLALRESRLIVEKILDGAPARAAGLLVGDLIVSIDGRITAELGFTDAIEALRGVAGTTVRLEIQRGAERFLLDVVRAQLAVSPPAGEE